MSREQMPRVSIGLVVYNGERFLPAALDSTLAQTFEDFELIISDNASTDRTQEICQDYATQDPRIRYFRNPANLGAGRNYRRAFALARGKYFRWANHDDTIAPTLIERCFDVLETNPDFVLAYGKTAFMDADGVVLSPFEDHMHIVFDSPSERFRYVLFHVGLCNVIYGLMRRDAMSRTALIGDRFAADLCFVAELALHGKFCEVPETLFLRRIHDGAYSSETDLRKQISFYHPTGKRRLPLRMWGRLWADVRAVERAPLNFAERMKARLFLMRWFMWKRAKFASEIKAHLLHRLPDAARRHAPESL